MTIKAQRRFLDVPIWFSRELHPHDLLVRAGYEEIAGEDVRIVYTAGTPDGDELNIGKIRVVDRAKTEAARDQILREREEPGHHLTIAHKGEVSRIRIRETIPGVSTTFSWEQGRRK